MGLVTKGPMVVRDIDVLASTSRAAGCTVYMSVPTVDEDAWRMLEPGTAHPLQRLRAVRELVDAGINAGVLMAPIVPGFSSSRTKLERTIKAIADHGARFVGCNVMYLQDGTRTHFMNFIAPRVPGDGAAVREAVREEVSAGGLSEGGQGDGQRAAGALRARTQARRHRADGLADQNPNRSGSRGDGLQDCRIAGLQKVGGLRKNVRR